MCEKSKISERLHNKPRSKKLNTKIDLTAMVSISFLLIIFYMVMIENNKPRSLSLGLPNNSCGWNGTSCGGGIKNRTMTLLLDDNNRIISYTGFLGLNENLPKILSYGKEGIRKELLKKNRQLQEIYSDKNKSTIVIIKPTKKSNFGNLVDILDEMNISNIDTYAIVNDFSYDEMKLLSSSKL